MQLLRSLIIPSGKVSPHYKKYVFWSFLSNVFVSMQTAMTTHSMLDVIGSTNGGDTIRTVNYIGKDIIGQIGSLVYMAKMGEKSDSDSRGFLDQASAIQQTSLFMMAMTPVLPHIAFLPVAGTANLLSNISFTGYGAINAKCIQEMSDGNVGEMYAKITTVNTMASSIGLSLGVGLCFAIPDHVTRGCLVPILGVARIYTFQKAIEDIT